MARAVVESFFNLLKRERIRRKKYKTREEARRDVFALRRLKAIAYRPTDDSEFFCVSACKIDPHGGVIGVQF